MYVPILSELIDFVVDTAKYFGVFSVDTYLKLQSHVDQLSCCYVVTLTGWLFDCLTSASPLWGRCRCRRVDICQGVSGRSRVMQHMCDHLTNGAGRRDAGREGQGLQSCMHFKKCNTKSAFWLVYINEWRSNDQTVGFLVLSTEITHCEWTDNVIEWYRAAYNSWAALCKKWLSVYRMSKIYYK